MVNQKTSKHADLNSDKANGIDEPLLMDLSEAQRALNIGRTLTFKLVKTGALQTVKLGGRRLVVRQSVRDLAARAS